MFATYARARARAEYGVRCLMSVGVANGMSNVFSTRSSQSSSLSSLSSLKGVQVIETVWFRVLRGAVFILPEKGFILPILPDVAR